VSSLARRSPRHTVELACEVVTRDVDEPLLLWATDLSPEGVWLETGQPIVDCGSELVVCLRPLVWWQARELIVFGEVARVSQGRRDQDVGGGVGVAFMDLTAGERFALRAWLRPRPERRPSRRGGPHLRNHDLRSHVCATVELPGPLYSAHPFASRVS
jgi:hypothetical protein